jgi:V/A-type H+-transporting ATPase subunit B
MTFLNQGEYENRSIETTLELGWDVLSALPQDELHRVSDTLIKEHYRQNSTHIPDNGPAPIAAEV